MQITDEISSLDPVKEQPWDGPKGPIWFVQGQFKGGGLFSLGAQTMERAKERHAEFLGLVGKPGSFEVEEKGQYQGKTKYKLLSWPGKPERPPGPFTAAGGTRGTYQVRYRDTPEGTHQEQDSIHRSVALTQAGVFLGIIKTQPNGGSLTVSDLRNVATDLYQWLRQGHELPPSTPVSESPAPPPSKDSPQTGSTKIDSPKIKCPNCGATESVRYARDKGEYYCWKKLDTELFDLDNQIKKGCGHVWKPNQTAAEKYMTLIDQAHTTARLQEIFKLIQESQKLGTVSVQESNDLDWLLAQAEQRITASEKSGAAHSEWHDGKVREAQRKEQQGGGFGPQF